MTEAFVLAMREALKATRWFADVWAPSLDRAVTVWNDPASPVDDKSKELARQWFLGMAAMTIVPNEILEAVALLAEDPETIVEAEVVFEGGPPPAGKQKAMLAGDLLSLDGRSTIGADRCVVKLAQSGQPSDGVTLVVNRRREKSGGYRFRLDFTSETTQAVETVDCLAAI